MRAGDLDTLVTIESPAERANGIGEMVITWSVFAKRWASFVALSGAEQQQFLSTETTTTHRVRMRYTPGLKPKMRLIAKGKRYEIMSVLERGRQQEHELMVMEFIT